MAERTKAPVLKTGMGKPIVGSNPTPSAFLCDFNICLGRCQSGRMGPPAKWLSGQSLDRGFESLPPRLNPKEPVLRQALFVNVFP